MSRDRRRFLTGEGAYTADLVVEGAVHAAFVRSDYAHARLMEVATEEARSMPGVLAVVTARDLGHVRGFPSFLRYPDRDGRPFSAPPRPVMASDRVRHVGEIVAMVVAETATAAQDAAERVLVRYADCPVITGWSDHEAPVDVPIHEAFPANVAYRGLFGDLAACRAAEARAAHVVTLEVSLPRVVPNAMEPRSAVGRWNAEEGVYDLWAPHQGIPEIRRDLAVALDVPAAQVRVHPVDVGGGFGARGPAYPEHAAVLVAARLVGRPVRWIGTRLEGFLGEHHGRGTRLSGRLAVDAAGRFQSLHVRLDGDLGAWVTPVGAHIHVHNPLQTLTGVYRIPLAAFEPTLHVTNAVPTGPYRGAGRPDIALLVERLVDEAAKVTGRDRIALRRRNGIPPARFPFTTATGATYDSGDYPRLLGRALAEADWKGFPARRRASARQGLLRGIGLSLFTEVAGGGPVAADEVELTVSAGVDGLVVDLGTVTGSTGQSHGEAFARIVERELGVPIASFRLTGSAAATTLAGAGSFGSRSTTSAGSAVALACRILKGRIAALAGPGEGLIDVIRKANDPDLLRVRASAPVSVTFPAGCHVAEVEIDPATGVTRVVSYVAVDDAGTVIDHDAVLGQIAGGVAQGIGEALGEIAVYDAAGQLLASSFMDYRMPRAADVPPIRIFDEGVPSPNNPLGAKGAGEAGTTGALGAVANAVADALGICGRTAPDMPFTPNRMVVPEFQASLRPRSRA
ncbi:MAG: xanthine dehydrogenase family protein molybdopterin-binding subunit [Phreatobacter sp.]|uniref:xanthine dehydrogenase family protein molybdopterin-binding subunit n=1 Tax=Phreatobacter sp. TaxID=1966341 RepID=UPI004037583A